MQRILFVCTGNTCRSPMAEILLRRLCREADMPVDIRSAGIAAADGFPISPQTEEVLGVTEDEKGLESQALTAEQVQWADLILTMTAAHKSLLADRFPGTESKTFPLKAYAEEVREAADVADPFGGSRETYEACAQEIENCLKQILRRWSRASDGNDA